ncbi:glycosyltransferase [Microbacterium sp. EYE_5]|uniref:glycosyltransferase n=1 Tax=unclassified Microbacterium TaxID=2609290 RepID=UPI002002B455|nr:MULTISPECIES: glycosyltransferase [unclassified Microbacterium]MCK6079844.1 glycosyltransferase [Microbacterium sp. EYE_382]MCK6085115.1 glycosyltransferase [Microbacterium sp. EYE_384]MCK6122659.1 glycosyltransferase [Microbacterium sp. EYE_80]MCK6125878.1 glycosyltransferase [Microbacterium sp. EYE_79]MCK6140799.1 glycosyltransferase [Microbacterium sp. EYE_39]
MSARPLRIVVIAPLRFPIRRPHAGGLESAVWAEVDALRRRGHEVTFVAPEGSDFLPPSSVFRLPPVTWPGGSAPTDKTWPESYHRDSAPALARALDEIAAHPQRYDVVSNHCLHPLPLQRAAGLGVPMVTTLHTPVDDAFVAAHAGSHGAGSAFFSVSSHTRVEWGAAGVPSRLLPNGVDPAAWALGPGGDDLVWFGRIVPEKAPHVAVEVARRLGRRLVIAGRIGDETYAREVLLPRIGGDVEYAGELEPAALARLVGRSGLALATPAWAEPFGLVGPEALMCGTPVVGFAVGGVPEIAAATFGMQLVPAGDVDEMTARVSGLLPNGTDAAFRALVRESAERRFSLAARISALEAAFADLVTAETAA